MLGPTNPTRLLILGALLLAVAIGAMWYFTGTRIPTGGGQVACTMETKLCPDGSSVGRIGPNCEFAACPGASSTQPGGDVPGKFCGGIATGAFPCPEGYACKLDGTYPDAGGHCVKQTWKVYTNQQCGFQLQYPADWFVTQHAGQFVLSSSSDENYGEVGGVAITCFLVQSSTDLVTWIKSEYQGEIDFRTTPLAYKTNQLGFKFIQLYSLPSESSDNSDSYFLGKDHVISVSASPLSKLNDIYDLIISTFKLTQ